MPRDTLTGSRIRERRSMVGLRQADLAREVGISASYLNLIEHNRRRIGGKLLVDIAGVLGVEPSLLTEGAEAALIATLREAAADAGAATSDTDRADEFAGRFPGWAEVLARLHRRIASLERTVETLSDRLTHDPHLAASLHEVLSTATAIRSTASILAEPGELEAVWRERFHRNLNEDARRLAESSKQLMTFLDESESGEEQRSVPREEAEAFVAANGYHFPELEDGTAEPQDLVDAAPQLDTPAARSIAREFLEQYREDAIRLPLDRVSDALEDLGPDPVALGRATGAEADAIFRRFATLPPGHLPADAGLVICDGSGALLYRKSAGGFAMPRFGAPCPLWPLFLALTRPLVPVRRPVIQKGRSVARFDCLAYARPHHAAAFDAVPIFRATMLILPIPGEDDTEDHDRIEVGSSCRVCPRKACPARREPSILREGF